MSTTFEKMMSESTSKGVRRGRPAFLTPEEKAVRKERAKVQNRLRQEARRRAFVVLQHRYSEEFETLMAEELQNLSNNDDRYKIPSI